MMFRVGVARGLWDCLICIVEFDMSVFDVFLLVCRSRDVL